MQIVSDYLGPILPNPTEMESRMRNVHEPTSGETNETIEPASGSN